MKKILFLIRLIRSDVSKNYEFVCRNIYTPISFYHANCVFCDIINNVNDDNTKCIINGICCLSVKIVHQFNLFDTILI